MSVFAVEFKVVTTGIAYVEAESEELARDVIAACDEVDEIIDESTQVEAAAQVIVTNAYPIEDDE